MRRATTVATPVGGVLEALTEAGTVETRAMVAGMMVATEAAEKMVEAKVAKVAAMEESMVVMGGMRAAMAATGK